MEKYSGKGWAFFLGSLLEVEVPSQAKVLDKFHLGGSQEERWPDWEDLDYQIPDRESHKVVCMLEVGFAPPEVGCSGGGSAAKRTAIG